MNFWNPKIWTSCLIWTSQNKEINIDSHSKFVIMTYMWCNVKWEIPMKNPFLESFKHFIIMNFWIVRIQSYFHKFIWIAILIFFNFFSQKHIFWKFDMGLCTCGLCRFPFRKLQMPWTFFDVSFDLSLRGFVGGCRFINQIL